MSFEDNMKRKQKKDARDALIRVSKLEHKDKTDNPITKQETKDVISNNNNEQETKDVILKGNTNTEYKTERNNKTVSDVKENLLSKYAEKTKKETVEDTHTRSTFLFRNDLSARLDKLAKGKRGFKTMFLNEAIESLLDELEKK